MAYIMNFLQRIFIFILLIFVQILTTKALPTTSSSLFNSTKTTTSTTTQTSTTRDPLLDYPEHAIDYLVKYGYLIEKRLNKLYKRAPNNTLYIAYTKSELVSAIFEYQVFMNIPTTGLLDKMTISKIHKKRCGMPDKIPRDNVHLKMVLTGSGKRKRRSMTFNKRNTFSNTPSSKILYWDIYPKPPTIAKYQHIWYVLEYAFNRWASVSDIVFIRGDYLQYSDIQIGFWKGKHGDNEDFDGPGGVLAHAHVSSKVIHIDVEEAFAGYNREMFLWLHPNNGTDLIQVAIHEIGHVLGLTHDNGSSDSVMNPVLKNFSPLTVYALSQNDIARVKASYGKCWPDKIDAIFTNKYLDGKTYIIKGPYIYQIDDPTVSVQQSWPRATTLDFFSTTFIDEAFWHTDHFLYFFDKDRYMIFDTTHDPTKDRAGPYNLHMNTRNIGFRGLKHHKYIDAAMVLQYGGKPTSFIFQDEYVYKWDLVDAGWHRTLIPSEKVAVGWPKKIVDVFPGLPSRIDTAFTWPYDGRTYFFAGNYFYIWLPDENRAEGVYGTFQWHNVCNVYQCMVAPRPTYNCESWEMTKATCNGCT